MKTKKRVSESIMEQAAKIEASQKSDVHPLTTQKMGVVTAQVEKLKDTVQLNYIQNHFSLHMPVGSGSIQNRAFEISQGGNFIYVTFDGMKGQIPAIGIDLRDLVQGAFDSAMINKLFK